MKKLLCGLVLVAAVVAAVPAMAFDFDDHVTLAPNGRGDLLIFPVYMILDNGWETKIQVTNTSSSYSTVAKVVFRSYVYSKELLDFMIYLSPTDVWTGKIVYSSDGPMLYSDDDSIMVAPNTFASLDNPVQQPLLSPPCEDDSNIFGYVEVFEAWATVVPPGQKPIPKYSTTLPSVKGSYEAESVAYIPQNILAGHFEIGNPTLGLVGAHDATVLQDYDNNLFLSIAGETFMGETARNTICEVEAALSKTKVGLYYYDNDLAWSLPMVTLPTKLVNNALCECADGLASTSVTVKSPFFAQNTLEDPYCYGYLAPLSISDLKESVSQGPLFSPAPTPGKELITEELHFILKRYAYEEGWLELSFADDTFCTPSIGAPDAIRYTGIPVIATNMFLGFTGSLPVFGGNWEFGSVAYSLDDFETAGVPVPDYQLSDSTVRIGDF